MTHWHLEPVQTDSTESSSLHQYRVLPGQNFVYTVVDRETRKAALVDPAWDPLGLLDEARTLGLEPSCVLLTHTHPDHMGGPTRNRVIPGVAELIDEVDLPVWVHQEEAELVRRFADLPERLLRPFTDGTSIERECRSYMNRHGTLANTPLAAHDGHDMPHRGEACVQPIQLLGDLSNDVGSAVAFYVFVAFHTYLPDSPRPRE